MGSDGFVAIGERATHQETQPFERGIRDPVAREEAVPSAGYQPPLEQQRQMLARIGLGRPGHRAQILDGALLPEQGLQQRETGRIGESPEPLRDQLERLPG